MRAVCSNCGWDLAVSRGRCGPCHVYLVRNGVERPEALIVRHGARIRQEEASRESPMARRVYLELVRGGIPPSRARRVVRTAYIPWISNACWLWPTPPPKGLAEELYAALIGPVPGAMVRECGQARCMYPRHLVSLTAQRLA